jgi:sulfite exporter TauE/SafE
MIAAPVIWGLLLGLGSSLHCAGMCGPIGCSLLLFGEPAHTRSHEVLRLAAMQLGRILSYVLLGLVFGTFGAGMQRQLDFSQLHQLLQWIAAATIIWLGFSTAGLVPSLALMDRAMLPLATGLARARIALAQGGPEIALLGGMLWGMTPCAMVYTALFNSLLTGNPSDGMLLMLAFGLGTVPAVVLSTLALARARSFARRPGRRTAGLLMVAAGVLALLLTVPGSPLCITGH